MANDQKPVISVRKLRKVYMMGQEHVVALHNIDLDIPRGEVCCIFGTSGSGKSTLLNQLAGLEKPTRGVVRIGGVPISQLNENQLAAFRQKHIGFVFQSYNLLPELTAAENVAMPLMFKGISRSQRLAMARALLHDSPIYVFDEATSNVDAESENDIMKAIHSLAGKKTVILISHRLANVVHSDCIYAMSNGRVIEQGTHAELLAKQGKYYELWNLQQGIFRRKKEEPAPVAPAAVVEEDDDGEAMTY